MKKVILILLILILTVLISFKIKKDLTEEMTFRLKEKEMNEPTMENVWGTHDKKTAFHWPT